MARVCDNCKFENKDNAVFCANCGAKMSADFVEKVPESESRERRWGCIGGLLISIAVLAIGISAYFIFGRPYIEEEVYSGLESFGSAAFSEIEDYHGDVEFNSISEEEINYITQTRNLVFEWLVFDGISFYQDEVILSLLLFDNVSVDYSFDLRVNSSGNLFINSADLPFVNFIFFNNNTLIETFEDLMNDTLLEEGNIKLLALQVTDENIFYVYESRD